jgi:hypothetical protein
MAGKAARLRRRWPSELSFAKSAAGSNGEQSSTLRSFSRAMLSQWFWAGIIAPRGHAFRGTRSLRNRAGWSLQSQCLACGESSTVGYDQTPHGFSDLEKIPAKSPSLSSKSDRRISRPAPPSKNLSRRQCGYTPEKGPAIRQIGRTSRCQIERVIANMQKKSKTSVPPMTAMSPYVSRGRVEHRQRLHLMVPAKDMGRRADTGDRLYRSSHDHSTAARHVGAAFGRVPPMYDHLRRSTIFGKNRIGFDYQRIGHKAISVANHPIARDDGVTKKFGVPNAIWEFSQLGIFIRICGTLFPL